MISPETSSYTYTTFGAFCTRVRKIAMPEALGESRKTAFDSYLVNALIKAQRYIDCLRKIQVSFYDAVDMSSQCGISTFMGPRGKVNVVYAFKKPGEEECLKHFFRPVSPGHMTCWTQQNSCTWASPHPDTNTYRPNYQLCDAYIADGTEEDDTCWKCEPKFVSRGQNGEIFLAPRPPCGYIVAVHWEGLRRSWQTSDAIVDDPDLIDWCAQYIQQEMSLRHDRDPQLSANLTESGREKFADMMYWCNEERRMKMEVDCANGLDTGNLNDMFLPIYAYAPDVEGALYPFP